ncbi:arsenate reductase (glutaredoxin) [Acinetobacter baumannii]|uniref:arsenate reductase (glutaredoxin) n=1 Tax=Acinetobacter baumannii TaxID=470 RepID=UPI00028C0C32|nr:arsenate reductase (glutaredoxin) [Acinetobacter baumannii]EHU1441376.1 arsenate reductase (glutaredoxin) [Acinetobacter baumannii]EHU1809196.1 arsenate reductase (glutaredoxin) [Acinetobacter baumannii]EHU2698584.1 arsenate reductase (glutaredoxin) [Acinetobacter baumannii]EKL57048.1 arsenate reductase [Acinetobacter baumannii OIFC110]MDV7492881.1 arsenate reductase (glutaredoxin) [Acinetobacter baumannii]
MSQKIKIYHNSACGTSRNTLALIRNTGIEPEVIEYLNNPPSKAELIKMISAAGLRVREAIRKNVEPYETYKLEQENWTEDQLLDFMLESPILINRPFVLTDKGVRLCRPSEVVLEILSEPQLGAFIKEDGEMVIDQQGNRVN